jgi:hypothetical protein
MAGSQAESSGAPPLLPGSPLWAIAERYRGRYVLPPISYGTVRDFADSADHLEGLAGANGDMKDLQRCWMLKSVLGNVEPGGRILEIGAGEPLLAGLLSRLSYEVTVVDPYDGSGNGPRSYEEFRRLYPDLEFVRDRFPPEAGINPGFAAIYSVSVLEHLPISSVDGVMGAIDELLNPESGSSIHAIDHVFAGWGSDAHLERLERLVARTGLSLPLLHETIARLEADPDTYLVSAEAHNRWRGDLSYDEYPMRRIASVHLFSRT